MATNVVKCSHIDIWEKSMRLSVREVKASLSKVLSLAQAGEVVEVTSHNKPIARVIGIPPHIETGLSRLMAAGAVTCSGDKPTFAAPVELTANEKLISTTVLEDRE